MLKTMEDSTDTTLSLSYDSWGFNSTLNPLEQPVDVMNKTWLQVLFISLYCVVFIVGITGNSLVVYVVAHSKAMQTITNIFIANLAVSDIMKCLLAVPFTPISGLLQSWVFGRVLCHIIPMSLGVSVHVSTLTSTAIAIDRYFVIVHPFRPRMKVMACMMLIGAIWLISLSISLPLAIYQRFSWDQVTGSITCDERWPLPTARQFFAVISLILQYIVPCSIITYCYASVSASLRQRARARLGKASRARDELELNKKRKANRMLIAMVSIFVCCWLPLNVTLLTTDYYEALGSWHYYTMMFFIAHLIAMSSIVYNPFLYGWMNENFRKEFQLVVPWLFTSFSRRRGGSSGGTHYSNKGGATTCTLGEKSCKPSIKTNKNAHTNNHKNNIKVETNNENTRHCLEARPQVAHDDTDKVKDSNIPMTSETTLQLILTQTSGGVTV